MAGAQETPRQKLIGMMYLVLTALLALQVSSEIINKFDLMNKSLEKSANEATDANQKRIVSMQEVISKQGNRAEDVAILKQAQEVKTRSAEMINYLEGIKKEMVQKSGGIKQETGGYTNPSAERNAGPCRRRLCCTASERCPFQSNRNGSFPGKRKAAGRWRFSG
jgi:gliding motility-associated protein GldM